MHKINLWHSQTREANIEMPLNVRLYIYCIVWAVGLNPDSLRSINKLMCNVNAGSSDPARMSWSLLNVLYALFICFSVAYKLMSLNPNFTYSTETYLQGKHYIPCKENPFHVILVIQCLTQFFRSIVFSGNQVIPVSYICLWENWNSALKIQKTSEVLHSSH